MRANIKTYQSFLLEGLVDDLRDKYIDLSQEEFDALTESDPTPTKKYLKKLLQFNKEGYSVSILKDLITTYHDLVIRNIITGVDRDIQSFKKFQDFEDVVNLNRYKKTNQEKKKAISKGESNSSEIIFETDNIIIRKIYNHEASCAFGKSTNWCITMNSGGHWKTYSSRYLLDFYFIEFKKPPVRNWNKIAVGVNINNIIIELRDIKDKEIDVDKFFEITGLPKDLFINTFTDEAKNIEELIAKLDRCDIHRFKILDLEKNLVEIQQDVEITMEKMPFVIKKIIGNLTINKVLISSLPDIIEGSIILNNCTFVTDLSINAEIFISRDCNNINKVKLNNCKNVTINSCNGLYNLETLSLPKEMEKLHVSNCNLKSLKGSPEIIHGDFICYSNNLKDLNFGPHIVEGLYNVKLNDLESLDGLAQEIGKLDISINDKDFSAQDIPEGITIKGKITL